MMRLSEKSCMFSDVERKSSVMVLMSSLPTGCSRHGDQQLRRLCCRLLRAWRVVPAGY